MHKNKKRKKAVTLIEILVVIGIAMGTIGMAAIFVKYQQPRIQLYASSQSLRSRLQKARQIALTSQIIHGISFDFENRTYELIDASGPWVIETYALPNNIEYRAISSFENNQVNFNASGAASQSGFVILKNSRDEQKTITINPSGYIEVE